jgi:hypothetical protein
MKTIAQCIAENIAYEKESIAEHEAIKSILSELVGKPFDRRTFSTKRLQGFEFVAQYSMFYIKGKREHLIGDNSSPFVNVDEFVRFDACNGSAAQERINKMQALNVERLQEIQESIAQSFENIKAQFLCLEREKFDSYSNPVYYDMLRAIHNEETSTYSSRIVLSDFFYIAKEKK